MDLIATGKFIAQLRKEKALSQEQLGEHIGVTNKTVSRWERGTYLPPAEMLLAMSQLFDVSVDELLIGKRLTQEERAAVEKEQSGQAEKASNFSLQEKIAFYKSKWLKEHIAAMCCWGIGIVGTLLAGALLAQPMLIASAMLLLVVAHGWRNNTMMAYVEHNAFDGTGWNGPPLAVNRKNVSISVVIINCVCAVIWNINLVVDLLYGYKNSAVFATHIICAIVWDVCAIIWILRYIKEKTEDHSTNAAL